MAEFCNQRLQLGLHTALLKLTYCVSSSLPERIMRCTSGTGPGVSTIGRLRVLKGPRLCLMTDFWATPNLDLGPSCVRDESCRPLSALSMTSLVRGTRPEGDGVLLDRLGPSHLLGASLLPRAHICASGEVCYWTGFEI